MKKCKNEITFDKNIDNSKRLLDFSNKLLKAMAKGLLANLVKIASEEFDMLVILTNQLYHNLELYPKEMINDDVYDQIIESGLIDDRLLKSFIDTYLPDKKLNFMPFYIENPPKDIRFKNLYPRIIGEVKNEKTTIGHIGIIFKDKKLEEWHLDAAEIFINHISVLMSFNRITGNNSTSQLYYYLKELFDFKVPEAKRKSSYENLFQLFPGQWKLIMSKTTISTDLKVYSRLVVNQLTKRYPNMLITIESDYIYILMNEKSTDKEIDDLVSILVAEGYTYNVLFEKINNFKLLNLTKSIANKLSKLQSTNQKSIIVADDLITEIALLFYLDAPITEFLIHPAINKMQIYDAKEASEYLKTLEILFENNFDRNKTSSKLHIHRNTLLYRINRYKELFDIDLNLSNEINRLFLSLQIYKLKNRDN